MLKNIIVPTAAGLGFLNITLNEHARRHNESGPVVFDSAVELNECLQCLKTGEVFTKVHAISDFVGQADHGRTVSAKPDFYVDLVIPKVGHVQLETAPTDKEVVVTLDAVLDRTETLSIEGSEKLKGNDGVRSLVVQNVMQLIRDPNLLETVCRRLTDDKIVEPVSSSATTQDKPAAPTPLSVSDMRMKEGTQEPSVTVWSFLAKFVPKVPLMPTSKPSEWSLLEVKYGCAICHDILAAPCILPCSHDFCSSCVEAMHSSASSLDVDVVRSCPCCRAEYLNVIYERTLDVDIFEQVSRMDVSQLSTAEANMRIEWLNRRKRSLKKIKKTLQQCDFEVKAEIEADEFIEDAVDVTLVLIIAATTLALIAIARLRK
jgi:hypothetical protein